MVLLLTTSNNQSRKSLLSKLLLVPVLVCHTKLMKYERSMEAVRNKELRLVRDIGRRAGEIIMGYYQRQIDVHPTRK